MNTKTFWETAGCTVRGISHINSNKPCQDKIYSLTLAGVTAIALADGASSARLSHFGAERVSQLVCRKICRDFGKFISSYDTLALKLDIINYLTSQLRLLAVNIKCDVKDLYSTLIFAASDGKNYIAANIGDGLIGAFRANNVYPIIEPYHGEFFNSTDFVEPASIFHMELKRGSLFPPDSAPDKESGKIKGFVLMSDGVNQSYYDIRKKIIVHRLEYVREKCFALKGSERRYFLLNELKAAADNIKSKDDYSIIIMNLKEQKKSVRVIHESSLELESELKVNANQKKIIANILSTRKEGMFLPEIIKISDYYGLDKDTVKTTLSVLCRLGYVRILPPRKYIIQI